jgi:DNA-binding transcriptional ArsR family regulator
MSRRGAVAERGGVSPAFAALGDPTRLNLVARLCAAGPLSTVQLTRETAFSRQGVTKHLRALEDAGLVRARRVGRDSVWELEADRLAEIQGFLNKISAQWDDVLARLKAMVESEN